MIIVGGTYYEISFEPQSRKLVGSGLRACLVASSIFPENPIDFYTAVDKNEEAELDYFSGLNPKIKIHATERLDSISFYYVHPLATPSIFPRLDVLVPPEKPDIIKADDVLLYGMLEGTFPVEATRVVYDPQSPVNPIPFSQTGSKADQLAIVINLGEARLISGKETNDIDGILEFFFTNEQAAVVVLKMGPRGAIVATKESRADVPIYETPSVWPIGSGDVFAATFACYWFSGKPPMEAANLASWNTANYCSTRGYVFPQMDTVPTIRPIEISGIPNGQIYLAGPFFTFAQRWLINEIYTVMVGMGLKVFSPWHDVGHGDASEVVPLDIDGLNRSKLIFAVLDGLDSGTLFENGYGIAKGLPVIGYVENESSESTKMMEGTGCILERDLTTAIYRSVWILAKHG